MSQHLVDHLPDGQQINLTMFADYIKPLGVFTHDIHCHALFYYYLHARRTYEENVLNGPANVYEGDLDSGFNFEQLFSSVASLYGVDQDAMAGWWPLIDEQCLLSGLPLMPEGWKYRFHSVILLNS